MRTGGHVILIAMCSEPQTDPGQQSSLTHSSGRENVSFDVMEN